MLENFLVVCESYPKWYRNLTFDDDRARELFDRGFIVPLKDRDEDGCRVVLCRSSALDPKKFVYSDEVKVLNIVNLTLLEEPETQVAGFVFVFDQKDAQTEYMASVSFSDVKAIVGCLQNAMSCRVKKLIWLNVHSLALPLFELGKKLSNKKQNEKNHFYKDTESVFKHVDKKILPKEYGGDGATIQEMVDNFRDVYESRKEKLIEIDRQKIDLTKVKGRPQDAIESFRKLEID